MAASNNLTSTLTANMQIFYDRVLLDQLRKVLVFHGIGVQKNLPRNAGKTVYWTRYNLLGAITTALSESVVPSSEALTSNTVSASLAQYGSWTSISDLLEMTAIDPVVESAVSNLGYQAGLTLDTLDRNVLDNGTQVAYANGKVSSSLASTDVLTASDVRKTARTLAGQDVRPFSGREFGAIVHVNNAYDLMGDTATGGWVQANTYVETSDYDNGEIGKVYGVRFMQSTNVSKSSITGGNSYATHFLGAGAVGVVEFDGGIHSYVKNPNDFDTSNPINQFSTVGWKFTYANKVLDDNRQVTLYCGGI